MNGLVGYGSSSSEDEDDPRTQVVPKPEDEIKLEAPTINGKQAAAFIEQQDALDHDTERPVIGPARPPQDATEASYDDETDEIFEALSDMTERQAIHQLTSPTTPLTASSIPPSPPGSPDPALAAKFKHFLILKSKGVHFNADLAAKSAFRNPNLLPTLMERGGIVGDLQYRSTIPEEVFDLKMIPEWAYKEALRDSQIRTQEEQSSRRNADGGRRIEFTKATVDDAHARRHKQPG